MLASVQSWSYHYSDTNMNYEQARHFCRTKYSDLVAIQNRQENEHLNRILPMNPTHYWIGIRKIHGNWTWVGTNKVLTKEAENWANKEPNNKKNNEDCVEMYVKRKIDEGKWNDEPCGKKKVALCYTAACNATSCSGQGECIETINNYKCSCYEGFYGSECEHAVTCQSLIRPEHASMECEDDYEEFQYNSVCSFSCREGFSLNGSRSLQCMSSGTWSSEIPKCQVVQCKNIAAQPHGHINCTHLWGEFNFQTLCRFGCSEGFKLTGSDKAECLSSGAWSSVPPNCTVVQCKSTTVQPPGYINCTSPLGEYSFQTSCRFGCSEGFELNGAHKTECLSSGAWSSAPPECTAQVISQIQEQDHMKSVVVTGGVTAASAISLAIAMLLIRQLRKGE
ncbi:hypothetical protein GDO86_007555, partial [Hymenochirus boettgeri]